jgi:hypothetical protein
VVRLYVGACVDPSGDNYTVGDELLVGTMLDRKVNTPSSFQFKVDNIGNAVGSLYAVDDKIDFHVGIEPLYQWGSLSALSFDGAGDYVDCTNAINPLTAITIIARIKPTVVNDWGQASIITKFGDTKYQWKIGLTNTGNVRFDVYKDQTTTTSAVSSNVATAGVWCHIAATYDGTNAYAYLNAVQSSAANMVGTIQNTDPKIYIGYEPVNGRYFNGVIDEVKIYSSALSAATILADYNGTHSTTNLVAYWDLDEGYGVTATDEAGTSDGAITNATWVNPKIMTGTIMDIDLERNEYGGNSLVIRGEDYLTVLGERLARASFPGAVDVSTILTNLLTEFANGEFTTVNVSASGTTVTNFTAGAETTILALMRRLADLPGASYDFYIDGGNDIVWHERAHASWSTSVTLDENNIRRMTVNRSTREKKTFIKVTGAMTPVEEAINRQSTVTDSVTLETNYYADDFIAQHNNLMAVELYLQKVGTPSADLTGRISIAKYNMPAGDFLDFTIREEDISTAAGWYRISTPMDTQVGTRYFIRLDKAGTNSSNTYKWYGDTPAVLDTERKAKQSTDGVYWTEADYDFSVKVYYGEYAEVTALNAATPRRDGVVALPSNSGIDDDTAQELADRILANYLQTAWKATVRFDCPSTEVKPSYLITLDESGDGLDSKTYRVERIRMEFGANRACDYLDADISATLPYTYLSEEDSKLRESLLQAGTAALESGATSEITTAKVGFAKADYSYTAIYPDEE